jgi:C-terminal processing protease CtpA/Prc
MRLMVRFQFSDTSNMINCVGPIGIKWHVHSDKTVTVADISRGSAASMKDVCVGDTVYAVNGDILESHSSEFSPYQILMQHVNDRRIDLLLLRSSSTVSHSSSAALVSDVRF